MRLLIDPIQLVWMVKEIASYAAAKRYLIHHPGELDGAFSSAFTPVF